MITYSTPYSISQNKQMTTFFNLLFKQICRSEIADKMIETVKKSVKNDSITSAKYASCKSILGKDKVNAYDTLIYSSLIKLGVFLKQDGILYINPLIADKSTARHYQLIIRFYNLLYKEQDFSSSTLEDLKYEAIAKGYLAWVNKQNEDIHYNNYLLEKTGQGTSQIPIKPLHDTEVYEIAFNTEKPKTNLSASHYRIYKHIQDTYRNVCYNYIRKLVEHHIKLLLEQQVITINSSKQTPEYQFAKMTKKFFKVLTDYKQTNLYKNNMRPSLQQQAIDYIDPIENIAKETTIQLQEQDETQEFINNQMASDYIQEQLKHSNFADIDLDISYDRPLPNNSPEERAKWYNENIEPDYTSDREIIERQALSLHNKILELKRAINIPPSEEIFKGCITKSDKCNALEQYKSSIQFKERTLKRKEEELYEMFETYALPNYNHTINSLLCWTSYLEENKNQML